jgi:GNAT superfamily N-acetyltransferase
VDTDLTFGEDYWSNQARRLAFKRFLISVFGLDLSLWESWGFWDNNYRPFSYFKDESIVANVCVYTMDMVVAGERCPVAQISAVGTLPEYRRQGLALDLMQRALAWADQHHQYFYLFADDIAYNLYRKCGFRPVTEQKAVVSMTAIQPTPGMELLSMEDPGDVKKVAALAKHRAPASNMLGVLNEKLFMFWCLYGVRDYVHYIADLDTVAIYRRSDEVITVYDIVAEEMPALAEVYPYIAGGVDERVEFLFMTDRLGLSEIVYEPVTGNGTHVRGAFPLEEMPFLFPVTSQA